MSTPPIRQLYKFVEKLDADFTAIKIIRGPFRNVVFRYGKVQFASEPPHLFEYTILESPLEEYDERSFEALLGMVLIDVLTRKFVEEEFPILPEELPLDETNDLPKRAD